MIQCAPAIIELTDVTKTLSGNNVVQSLNFHVSKGEIVALLGRTGAGKSTLLNLIMGTIAADKGSIRVAGVDPYKQFKDLRGRLAVSFQTDRLLPWRTAVENVELGLLILGQSKHAARKVAETWLERVKLVGYSNYYVHQLSGGMRQRVSLARALCIDPELLLLDESFSQLDHVTSQSLRSDFSRLAREFEKTCLLVTHRIDDAVEMADRVVVIAPGAKVCLEKSIDAGLRSDPRALNELRNQIAQAMESDH